MGTALGSGGKVESLAPDQIKSFLPEELVGLKRTQQAVERNGAIGMQISCWLTVHAQASAAG
jgi:hypothetical protein